MKYLKKCLYASAIIAYVPCLNGYFNSQGLVTGPGLSYSFTKGTISHFIQAPLFTKTNIRAALESYSLYFSQKAFGVQPLFRGEWLIFKPKRKKKDLWV